MQQVFQNKMNQLTEYMIPLLRQGVDITGLYIVQAHLTSLKAVVNPITILMNLFSHKQLARMLSLTQKRAKQLKNIYGSYNKENDLTRFEDIERFKVSVKDFDQMPLEDLTVICQQLLQTLQEWQVIQAKSERFRLAFQQQHTNSLTLSPEELKKQLETQLFLLKFSNQRQFKITESTECFSSFEEQQSPLRHKKLGENDVSMLFEFVIRWSNQVCQEIQDFKSIIQITKEESSVDTDGEFLIARRTNSSCLAYQLKGKQNNYLEYPDYKSKLNFKNKAGKHQIKRDQQKMVSFELNMFQSSSTKSNITVKSNGKQRKVMSEIGQKMIRQPEVKSKRSEECCKCVIY